MLSKTDRQSVRVRALRLFVSPSARHEKTQPERVCPSWVLVWDYFYWYCTGFFIQGAFSNLRRVPSPAQLPEGHGAGGGHDQNQQRGKGRFPIPPGRKAAYCPRALAPGMGIAARLRTGCGGPFLPSWSLPRSSATWARRKRFGRWRPSAPRQRFSVRSPGI